ncbi:MAG: AAA family ATPase [Deltaproteobacteria bacterium]|nr:AAA family ATPase [Deltaproteobacteria bacterium]MCF8120220.1 AAA family ATPase [Deltaproteobacteria bacterium]
MVISTLYSDFPIITPLVEIREIFLIEFLPERGKISTIYQRYILQNVLNSLADTPAVFVHGPRQAGKTTLVQQIAAEQYPAVYVTLDDLTVLSAVSRDPAGFVKNIGKPVIIDEVQRVPDLLLAEISWKISLCARSPNSSPGQIIGQDLTIFDLTPVRRWTSFWRIRAAA